MGVVYCCGRLADLGDEFFAVEVKDVMFVCFREPVGGYIWGEVSGDNV